MRPVQKSKANASYPNPTTFTFSGRSVNSIQRVLKRTSAVSVPVQDCLDAWLRQVEGRPPLSGSRSDQKQAVDAIKEKVTAAYKLASVPLTDELGPFCSFCETPLSGLLEVEHCVPKSEYPTFSLKWENFLLACSACNTAKGDVPSRSTVRGWSQARLSNEHGFYSEIRSHHYVWADVGGTSYNWLPLVLEFYDSAGGAWAVLPMNDAAHLDNELISSDTAKREVKAKIYDRASKAQVQRIVRTQLGSSAAAAGRSSEMLQLCALNDDGNSRSTYDRRVLNRTVAWFRCLQSLKTYKTANDPVMQAATWKMLLQNSAAVGFYSVWLSIIRFHDVALAKTFVTDSNQKLYYPGTDTRYLP
jgi:5-methylcytosine-specific restriction endonuclease McrA